MSQLSVVQVSPYVASAIIEHGKRRGVAAGYLLGTRTTSDIEVMDYIPMTNTPPYADVLSKAYTSERDRRVKAKEAFVNCALIGWYSAGACPEDTTREQYKGWCEATAASFAHRVARQALYIHCALPDRNQRTLQWSACITRNQRLEEEAEGKTKHTTVCARVLELRVCITAQDHAASNVFLNHVASLAFYGGGDAHARSDVMNLDHVISQSLAQAQPVEEALVKVQCELQAAIAAANHKPEEHRTFLEELNLIHRIKEEESAAQQSSSSREDINTQRFKDALMIKCMVMILRKEVNQIERLAYQYFDGPRLINDGGNYQRNYS